MEFILAFVLLALVVFGMAIGVIVKGKTIKGSCGGLNNIEGLQKSCMCDSPCEKRRAAIERQRQLEQRIELR